MDFIKPYIKSAATNEAQDIIIKKLNLKDFAKRLLH
jgi:hypothetical protein